MIDDPPHVDVKPLKDKSASFHWEKKLLPEELPPTAAEVTKKVKNLAPGLIRFLTTAESVTQFMQEVGAPLQPSTLSS